ncbi:hypothetical protein A374_01164 [Fictibacillus macauensis ZFHKF-1]|uniref:DUF5081 domain-containing protein n=1 Tax=Fictibacillus macauensis ZFHKF-1 TaxID=1196324 RepID=I8UK39_9BACL|nr:DUF5081 family protein [Fictibacillus macauensis]EIT87250.1 hypothetical protein A374_01164 [Fictibacillus macauensis ZFHKF-1]
MTINNNYFSAPELYLIAGALGLEYVFGLPDKEIFQFQGEQTFKNAHEQLKEKRILNLAGNITSGGAAVIQAVEIYTLSEKYVRLNNSIFAFKEKKHNEVVCLVESKEGYQLHIYSKMDLLKILMNNIPIMSREPLPDEKNYLKKELSLDERETVKGMQGVAPLNLEWVHVKNEPAITTNAQFYQQWVIFNYEEKLIMMDAINKKYYQASQYWFLKILFDELDFPYKEGI